MLYICPTPIGNLEDITIRTLNTLKSVDEIYCEDTRHSIKLLNYYDIKKPLLSLHKYNENIKSQEIINKIKDGKTIAYISDAGMPGISDPGALLIQDCIKENVQFTTLPGASAMIVALVSSGMDTGNFTFVGFLDRDNKKKKKQLESLSQKQETIIVYEAPHRVENTLKHMWESFGNRNIVIAREISKKFEEYIRTDLKSINDSIINNTTKLLGELVIVVQGNNKKQEDKSLLDDDIIKLLLNKKNQGFSTKDAVKLISKEYNLNKNKVYELSISCMYYDVD